MSKGTTKEQRQVREYVSHARKQMEEANKKYPKDQMVRLPHDAWPEAAQMDNPPREVWRSREFFVMVFDDKNGFTRISACRAMIDDEGRWMDGITWDELFMIKCAVGFAHSDCVEVFPAMHDLVNVANMRHLWVMEDPIPYKWKELKKDKKGDYVDECMVYGCDGKCYKTDNTTDANQCDTCGKEYIF